MTEDPRIEAMLKYLETALKLEAIDEFKMKFQGSYLPLAECLELWRKPPHPRDQLRWFNARMQELLKVRGHD